LCRSGSTSTGNDSTGKLCWADDIQQATLLLLTFCHAIAFTTKYHNVLEAIAILKGHGRGRMRQNVMRLRQELQPEECMIEFPKIREGVLGVWT
jgi:hypothetical protein